MTEHDFAENKVPFVFAAVLLFSDGGMIEWQTLPPGSGRVCLLLTFCGKMFFS